MAVRPPGKDELAVIARGYGMHLSDQDLGSFGPMVAGLLSSYDAVEELYAQTAPQPPAGRATITGKSVCEDLCFSGGSHTPTAWSRTPGRSRSSSPSTTSTRPSASRRARPMASRSG
jgi:hypothetical protein